MELTHTAIVVDRVPKQNLAIVLNGRKNAGYEEPRKINGFVMGSLRGEAVTAYYAPHPRCRCGRHHF